MTTGTSDIRRLTGEGDNAPGIVPRPRARRLTRIVIPAVIIIGVLSVGGFAAWRAFQPLQNVWVMPVIARPAMRLAGGVEATGSTGAQGDAPAGAVLSDNAIVAVAPGWVEPDPYAVTVSAFTEGIVKEVLALEGQRVQAGDVVARLDSTDATLTLRRAEAERDAARAEETWAAVILKSAESGLQNVQNGGGVETADGRRRGAEESLTQARAALARAQTQLRAREIMVEQATLDLSRHEVRTPVAGLVMARLVEPGTHTGMGMGMMSEKGAAVGGMAGMPGMGRPAAGASSKDDMSGGVIRIFDPAKLQARAEVAVADSVKVQVGMPAQMTCDAAPEVAFRGVVTRIVPAVDQQKNTVDVKVAIEHSEGMLRPGMQMRVKFFKPAPTATPAPAPSEAARPAAPAREGAPGALRTMVPTRGIREVNGNRGRVLVAGTKEPGGPVRLEERELTMIGEPESGYVEVSGPITAGERIVVRAQHGAEPGERVNVVGELSPVTN